jgi:aminoglycoside phosphotransferase (APT) family kinase protein
VPSGCLHRSDHAPPEKDNRSAATAGWPRPVKGCLRRRLDVVARACASQEAPLVRGVAEKLEAVLAEVLCGFAHGVFLNGNLLVENGRLAGVVDWDTAGRARSSSAR